ncbi:hypothetical protein, partial [uncultured Marinobacter sp.]|uniref:hypothetical protein n=1 Tax=uncultured Marinobacter sp. TaxID=187379 RepID=UPI0025948D2A
MSPNDDLPFGDTKPGLRIEALLLNEAPMPDPLVREELEAVLGLGCLPAAFPDTRFELDMVKFVYRSTCIGTYY